MYKITLSLLLALTLIACSPKSISQKDQSSQKSKSARPHNVILMIGDGMGLTQITAAMYMQEEPLNLERFPIVGLHKSYSGDKLITDSAAGATAFACGVKTYNGAIGVDMDTIPQITILEEAESNALSTGLIATSSIVHATPASFIAHQPQRKMYEAIAADFLKTEIELFIGGGKKYFDRRETDNRNLYEELTNKGYLVSDYFKEDFSQFKAEPKKRIAYFTADKEPLQVEQGRDYLVPATSLAIDFLDNFDEKGFFLMIEGSQIDWGGHANSSNYIITELHDFDKAIGKVLDFAAREKNTLVVITADHETGGYTITGGRRDSLVTQFTTGKHTPDLIPVFAYGPGAEAFSGIYENTAIYYKLRQVMGLAPKP